MSEMNNLRVGKYVNVYQDPYTGERLEGVARLVKLISADHTVENWEV